MQGCEYMMDPNWKENSRIDLAVPVEMDGEIVMMEPIFCDPADGLRVLEHYYGGRECAELAGGANPDGLEHALEIYYGGHAASSSGGANPADEMEPAADAEPADELTDAELHFLCTGESIKRILGGLFRASNGKSDF